MRIIGRKKWGARAPRSRARFSAPATVTYIHHTVSHPGDGSVAGERAALRELQRFHMDSRRYSDLGYSFAIFPSGRVYRLRGWQVVGAHTLGHNSTSHAFVFVGNYQTSKPTRAALRSAGELHALGVERGKIRPDAPIKGHRQAPGAATACPGDNLQARLGVIRRVARRTGEK